MNESYAEWLIKRKTPAYCYILNVIMLFLAAIGVYMGLTYGVIGVILMFLAGGGAYFVIRNSNVEFEYLYVAGQLTIDRIYGKAKRKKAWEGTMEEIQIIAPSDSYALKDYYVNDMKIMDFSSGTGVKGTYVLIARQGSQTVKIIFEPNEKMLQCFRQTSPRKVLQ